MKPLRPLGYNAAGDKGEVEQCLNADIDLDLSLYVSFLLPLFDKVDNHTWVKVAGYARGVKLVKRNGRLCCVGGRQSKVCVYLTGLWCFERCYKGIGRKTDYIPPHILHLARKLTIIASPWDADLIAIAAFLSRRTSWITNTVSWVREIAMRGVKKGTIEYVATKYRSYQLKQLLEVVDELLNVIEPIRRLETVNPWWMRRRLLSVKYVGPKVADAILLFTGVTSSVAPYDTHLARMLNEMGLPHTAPVKTYCRRFSCVECPLRSRCGSTLTVSLYGEAAGLIQSAAYVYYSLNGRLDKLRRYLTRTERFPRL